MFIVRVGEHNWKDKVDDGIDHMIESFEIHPRFSRLTEESVHYDFAVATLERPVVLSNHVNLVCLPPSDLDLAESQAMISGWGSTIKPIDEHAASPFLKVALVTVLSDKECKDESSVFEKDNMICVADEDGVGSCRGDSGGNGLFRSEARKKYESF